MELQQSKFDVRQLGFSDIGIRFATDYTRRAFFAFGGDDFLVNGTGNAFGAVQREAENNLQSGLDYGRIWTRAAVDLLFRERLRQKLLRLERLYLSCGVVRGCILVFVPLAAVLGLGKVEGLQTVGAIGLRDKVRANAQVKFLAGRREK